MDPDFWLSQNIVQRAKEKISNIDEKYVNEANTYVDQRNRSSRILLSRISRTVAGFALLLVLSAVKIYRVGVF